MDIESFVGITQDVVLEAQRKARNREAQRSSRKRRTEEKARQNNIAATVSPSVCPQRAAPNAVTNHIGDTLRYDAPWTIDCADLLASAQEQMEGDCNLSTPWPLHVDSGSLGTTAFHIAAAQGHTSFLKLVVQCGIDTSVRDKEGQTALHLAIKHGHADAAIFLVENGVDLKATDHQGWTALHRAAEAGLEDVAFCLIRHGADINVRIDPE